MARKGGLGKGLDALFVENDTASGGAVTVKLTEIEPNKNQPRKRFDEETLAQLAESIAAHGVLQPLLVRPQVNGRYTLVAGERRWRACRMAGLSEVPVIIREMDDREMAEIALVENLQREDLDPIEEASGFRELMDAFGCTQDEVARRVGKSRPAVANALRLLALPDAVVPMVRDGRLSAGHARALLALPETEDIEAVAAEIVRKGLTVRQVERRGKKAASPTRAPAELDRYCEEMQLALNEALGQKTTVSFNGKKGALTIEFYSKAELKALADKLTNG